MTTLPLVQSTGGVYGIQVAGQPAGQVQEGIDGHTGDGTSLSGINIHDYQEVVMVQGNNSAEYSRVGYFNFITKSGSNQFHGRAHYWHQNSALSARSFFDATKPKNLFHTMHADFMTALLALLFAYAAAAADTGRLWVRLVDERGASTAARIHVRDSAGKTYIPSGSLGRESGRISGSFFHASSHFQIEIPTGQATIEALKGFEFAPVKQQVELKANQTTIATITLKRWIDLPALGWHSGDVHMHPNHVLGGVYMTMEDCRVYAEAEDIRVANLLISSTDADHVYDTEYFRGGKPDPLSTKDYLLVVQQEFRNTSAMYGHMPLLGISKLVEPFFSGQPDSKQWEDYPPNYTIAKAAKDQGGAVCYTHPANREEIPVGPHLAREFAVDLALGVVDALDILGNGVEEAGCWMYYRVLNCGLKCSASSGSDSRMDVLRHAVSGGGKVYVKTGNPLSYEKWVDGYKGGRTFVTNGPVLFLDVDGKEPGDEIQLSGPRSLKVRARVQSPHVPFTVLELIVNGQVVATAKPSNGSSTAELNHTLRVERSSWVAARVWGDRHPLVVNDPRAFAHTSPVYCYLNKQRIAFPEDAKIVVAWIDRLIQDVVSSPRFSTEARRQEVIALFRKAQGYYAEIANGASKTPTARAYR